MSTILVIEDSAFTRSKIREALTASGHTVLEAAEGSKGLHMAYTSAPDCIVLDLIMPEIDGLKILKALQDAGSRVPVVVMTADIQESVRQQCLSLGAAAFVNKPAQAEDIRREVDTVLKGTTS